MAEDKESKLDKIAKKLAPDVITKKVSMKHLRARSKYKIEKPYSEDWDTFRKDLIKYIQHHHKEVYKTELPEDLAYHKAVQILERSEREGGFGGIGPAFEHARRGRLEEVITKMSDGLRREHETAYHAHVHHEIDPFDYESHKKIAQDFLDKWGKHLPRDFKKKSADELAGDYQSLLKANQQLIEGNLKPLMEKYKPKVKHEEEKKAD